MREHLKGFVAGIITTVALLVLLGATSGAVGKYQPTSSQGVMAILDTQTGIVHTFSSGEDNSIFTTIDLIKGTAYRK